MFAIRFAVAALLLSLVAIPAFGAPVEKINIGLKDVIDTVESRFRIERETGLPFLRDVTADFFQRSTIAQKQREMRADGQMFFRTATGSEPLKFRFDYFRPTSQEIVCNGLVLWMYLPENRQVIESDVSFFFDAAASTTTRAVNFLQGLGQISSDFEITYSPQRQDVAGNYILQLMPRRAMATIERLFIVVSRDAVINRVAPQQMSFREEFAFPILSTTVEDHQGNTTIMEFSNVRTNTNLPVSLFDFIVPAGIQVVRPPTGPPGAPGGR